MYRPMSVIWAELPEINMMDGWIGWYMHAVMLHECPCDDVACMVWHCLVTAWTDLQTVTCLSVWCNRWQVHILSSWSNLETNIRASWGNLFFPLLPNCELDICIHYSECVGWVVKFNSPGGSTVAHYLFYSCYHGHNSKASFNIQYWWLSLNVSQSIGCRFGIVVTHWSQST